MQINLPRNIIEIFYGKEETRLLIFTCVGPPGVGQGGPYKVAQEENENIRVDFYPNCLYFCVKQDRKYSTFPPLDLFVDGGGRTIHVLRHRKNYRKENKA